MTGSASARPAGAVPGLVAGLLGTDVAMNAATLDVSHGAAGVVSSLLVPSIDTLVVVAILMAGSRGGAGPRRALRVAVAVAGVLLLVLRAGLRFSWSAPGGAAGWLIAVAAAAACGAALYALAVPVLRGLANTVVRSVTLLAIAVAAVIQVILARTLFTASVLPAALRALLSAG